jgi:hypothetical protein
VPGYRESCVGRRDDQGAARSPVPQMAVQEGTRSSTLRVLEEALGLTTTGDTTDAVATEGAYYLERILPAERGLRGPPWWSRAGAASGLCGGSVQLAAGRWAPRGTLATAVPA